jgi:putative inorganic carbon (HCO3(-)) transporter
VLSWRPDRRVAFALLLVLNVGLLALLLLTQSRSAWIAAVGSLLSLWLFAVLVSPPSGRRRFAGVLLLVVLLLLLVGLFAVGPARLQQLWDEPPGRTPLGTLTTLEARKEIWHWALLTIQDFPLTGSGLGAFRRVAHRLYPLEIPQAGDIAHAHNIFLQVALDAGLPGLVAYLALLGSGLFMALQVARRVPEYRPFALGLATALAAFHLFGLADAIAPGAKPGLLYWASLGLVTALHQLAQERAGPLSLAGEVSDGKRRRTFAGN